MARFRFYHQDSATKNKDIQRKRIGTKGIIKKSELVPGLGTEILRVKSVGNCSHGRALFLSVEKCVEK